MAYQRREPGDEVIIAVLQERAERFPDRGFSKYYKLIRRRGHDWNHKRVHRVYCALGLNRRRLGKKRLPPRDPAAGGAKRGQPQLVDGLHERCVVVRPAVSNREVLSIEIDLNLPAARVVRVLERIAAWRGYPEKIRMDNGPEFIAGSLADWAQQHGVELEFIEPGRPMQNGFIERLNRSYREAVLDMYVFKTLDEVREWTEAWIADYNEVLPHDSLGDLIPVEYRVLHHPEPLVMGGTDLGVFITCSGRSWTAKPSTTSGWRSTRTSRWAIHVSMPGSKPRPGKGGKPSRVAGRVCSAMNPRRTTRGRGNWGCEAEYQR